MKKRILLLAMLGLTLCVKADVWDGASLDAGWYDEQQTEFHIYSADEFNGLSQLVNAFGFSFEGKIVYLENDIDLNGYQWTPIGYGNTSFSGKEFCGTFDGKGHSISNLYIDTSQLPNPAGVMTVGLFGNVKGTITSLRVTATIDYKQSMGVVADNVQYMGGIMANGGSIDHCSCMTTYNFYKSGDSFTYAGLMAGQAENIEYCKADGGVNYWSNFNAYMSGHFGGLVANARGVIRQCAVTGRLSIPAYPTTNGSYIGGIAAYASKIEDCIFSGILSVYDYSYNKQNTFVGGICAAHETVINNVVFAPEDFRTDVAQYFIGSIGPTYTQFSVSNAFYNSNFAMVSESYGTGVSSDYLTSGMRLDGFSTDVWEFKSGSYPQLKNLKEKYRISFPVENGRISILVGEGESATIDVDAEQGWKLSALYVDYMDCTWQLSGGQYTFDNVLANHVVNAVFESVATYIRSATQGTAPGIKIEEDGVILLKDLPQQTRINVYDLQGKLIKSVTASESELMQLGKGIFIINVGDKNYKVSF